MAEVSLAALRANCRQASALVGPGVRVMAVVKADAYGHGAVAAARAFVDAGAAALGVSTVDEGIEIARAGLGVPIVVLGGTFPGEERAVVAHGLGTAVWSAESARALAAAAAAAGTTVAVHVKLNTGMTRLGLDLSGVGAFGTALREMPRLVVEGIFSHLASADAVDSAAVRAQLARFRAALELFGKLGFRPPHVHLANSAAVLSWPEAHFTMVRPGLMLYGYAPAPHLVARATLRPALRFRTALAQVRRVASETPVGYGGTFVTARPSLIGVVPLGYADGFHRLNSNRARMLVHGVRVPVAGRVCMDHTMLDLTEMPSAEVGDEVVAFGRQEDGVIGADEVGGWCDTISYEVLTSVGRRVPRVHVEEFDA